LAKVSRGAAVFSSACSAGFEGCGRDGTGCAAAALLAVALLAVFSSAGAVLTGGAAASGCGCGSCAGAEAGFVASARGTGSAGAVETDIGSADSLRSSLDTVCEGGWAMFAAR